MRKFIIFSDLDGSLLHAENYSFDEAVPALELIKKGSIPLILCSSKTRAEMEAYRKRLENSHPFIAENGGGVFIPKAYFREPYPADTKVTCDGDYDSIVIGTSHNELWQVFDGLRKARQVRVRGFSEMSAEEISNISGLPIDEAALAGRREFGEPFIFEEAIDEYFLKAIEENGFHWTQGRFFHIMGDNDKGKAVKILQLLFEREYGAIETIALGDGFNDLPMLREVDHPVLIPKEDGSFDNRIDLPNIIKAPQPGSEGWNRAVIRLLGRQ